MTIASTIPVLSSAGISSPSFADVLDYLKTQYKSIYGADVYLENDSQDGQFLSVLAKSISDNNNAAVAIVASFSPATATGVGLSGIVKQNGITRQVATSSTASLVITGTAGTIITNGLVQDAAGNKWALPSPTTIPAAGVVTVTATCAAPGAVMAPANSIATIITPQLGWQGATNPTAATAGSPAESDGALRQRQALSVGMAATGPLSVVLGAVAAVAGVVRYAAYENPTNATDANGIPPRSLAIVTDGGSAAAIAQAIANKKTVGTPTFGSTTQTITNIYGTPQKIQFSPVAAQRVVVAITLSPIAGYSAAIGAKIQAAVAAALNAIPIGQNVFVTRLFAPANLTGDPDGASYEILSLKISLFGGAPAQSDIVIAYNQAASCSASDVSITVGSSGATTGGSSGNSTTGGAGDSSDDGT